MPTDGQPKVGTIKLKLSFASLAGSASSANGPSTPAFNGLGAGQAKSVTGSGVGYPNGSNGSATDGLARRGPLKTSWHPHTPLSSVPSTPIKYTPSSHHKTRPAESSSKSKSAKGKSKATPIQHRPSAIPPRLLSSGPSTPRAPSPLATDSSHIGPADEDGDVKMEHLGNGDDDPLPPPLSPGVSVEVATPPALVNTPEVDEAESRARQAARIQKMKRPLRELISKILVELNRKDEYLLFCQPVNVDDFPDYLDIIGGEENMMDFETMQHKCDDGEYTSFDTFEADLRTLATAAQTFNPPGSIPYGSAQKILNLGLKQIEKSRPLVRTPSPSPSPTRRPSRSDAGTSYRGQSTFSGREGTAPLSGLPTNDLPPEHYIPAEMLDHPPNSLSAQAVGWSLNGGKRQWTKRQLRGREKFAGKWRHWALDGSRDLAEMDNVTEWFNFGETVHGPTSSWKPDWKNVRKDPIWWDIELGGPQGQAPLPFTPYPHPFRLRSREYDQFDWGVYPEIIAQARLLGSKSNTPDILALSEHLRPEKPTFKRSPLVPSNFVDVYDGHLDSQPDDVLSQVVYGDAIGEAYSRSVDAFVAGAEKMTEEAGANVKKEEDGVEERVKLGDWVRENWHGGVMSSKTRDTISRTLQEVSQLREALENGTPLTKRQEAVYKVAKNEYARRALQTITKPTNPLDIRPLLVEQADFLWPGVGGRSGVSDGLGWTGKEIIRLSQEIKAETTKVENGTLKRKLDDDKDAVKVEDVFLKKVKLEESTVDSAASSPLSEPPESPPNTDEIGGETKEEDPQAERANGMRKLRLELIALCKFYPLAALKKMDKAEAEKLLPPNVRGLMSRK